MKFHSIKCLIQRFERILTHFYSEFDGDKEEFLFLLIEFSSFSFVIYAKFRDLMPLYSIQYLRLNRIKLCFKQKKKKIP